MRCSIKYCSTSSRCLPHGCTAERTSPPPPQRPAPRLLPYYVLFTRCLSYRQHLSFLFAGRTSPPPPQRLAPRFCPRSPSLTTLWRRTGPPAAGTPTTTKRSWRYAGRPACCAVKCSVCYPWYRRLMVSPPARAVLFLSAVCAFFACSKLIAGRHPCQRCLQPGLFTCTPWSTQLPQPASSTFRNLPDPEGRQGRRPRRCNHRSIQHLT